jgi:hypothetical protein
MVHRTARTRLRLATFGAALSLSACALPGQNPRPGLRGYGTPDVSAYLPADQVTSVQALLDRCAQVPRTTTPSETQGLAASCRQLHHTLRNQPGNAVPGPAL